MSRNQEKSSAAGPVVLFMAVLNAIILEQGIVEGQAWYPLLFVTVPLFILSAIHSKSKVPAHLGVAYRFRKAKKSVGNDKREKESLDGRKSSRPLVASAE